ncbi:MAG: Ig-like domain-containing protein [Candidatus Kaiserbacteria bacterium]|nr:Ig-like domain-containing protein [Candidatus Kaiserbacteria bacterium]
MSVAIARYKWAGLFIIISLIATSTVTTLVAHSQQKTAQPYGVTLDTKYDTGVHNDRITSKNRLGFIVGNTIRNAKVYLHLERRGPNSVHREKFFGKGNGRSLKIVTGDLLRGTWFVTATQIDGSKAESLPTSSIRVVVDTIKPRATITRGYREAYIKRGQTGDFTIRFSEQVIGFTKSDIQVSKGTISTPRQADDPLVYTFTYTPPSSGPSGFASIHIPEDSFTDLAGNSSVASNPVSVTYQGEPLRPSSESKEDVAEDTSDDTADDSADTDSSSGTDTDTVVTNTGSGKETTDTDNSDDDTTETTVEIKWDRTPPTVYPHLTGFYADYGRDTVITAGSYKQTGDTIYTYVVFSENMRHTRSNASNAKPTVFYRIGNNDNQYDIINNSSTLKHGDCKPDHVVRTSAYICRYDVQNSARGAFTVRVGLPTSDISGNVIAGSYTHRDLIFLNSDLVTESKDADDTSSSTSSSSSSGSSTSSSSSSSSSNSKDSSTSSSSSSSSSDSKGSSDSKSKGGSGGGGGSAIAPGGVGNDTPSISTPASIAGQPFATLFSQGQSGIAVRDVQVALNATSCKVAKAGVGSPGNETTYYGQLTTNAVACYQQARGLPITGNLDELTNLRLQISYVKHLILQYFDDNGIDPRDYGLTRSDLEE